ncbi:MAG: hypothetical protein IT366_21425 [Candidatus Hydrogenedentes bacterium]|nr:hypothetical protein [Candidatus Hydrogenedentota bacterium]
MSETSVVLAQPIVTDITTVAPLGDSIRQRCMELAVIDSQETAELAGSIVKDAARVKAQILQHIDPVVETAHKAHKAATTLRNKLLDFEADVKGLNQRLGAYLAEQRRIADEARRAAEQKAREEAERLRREQEEAALAKAAALEAEGRHVAATLALHEAEKPVPVVKPEPVMEAPKVAGISLRDNWKWRVVNEAAVPREFLQINESMIGAIVRSQKDRANIPGIEIYNEPISVNR